MTLTDLARGRMLEWHAGQTRWDGVTPYSTHPEKVVEILTSFGITDQLLISAAYLHDVLEDTYITYDMIKFEFGEVVADIVQQLTHHSLTDEEYFEYIRNLTFPARLIKTADIIANLTDADAIRLSRHFIDKRLEALNIIWSSK